MNTTHNTYEVAIIIPTLNEERFIDQCLQTLIRQTFPFEKMDVMIADGGSHDKTCNIVANWQQRFSNIRLLNNPKRIQSAAFNLGIANSCAPYLIRLDAHTQYDPHYIELCIHHLEQHSEYGNVGGVWQIKAQNNSLVATANALLNCSRFGIGGASFRVGADAGEVDSVPFGAFPRTVVEQIGGMREDLARGEDNEYNSRIRKAGFKIYLDPQIVSTYYARATFSSSCQQMYANGKSIGNLFYIDRQSIGLRHIVPLGFVLALLFCTILTICTASGWILLSTLLGLYFAVNICATVTICNKHGWRYIIILPILFFSVHISYGVGTLVGLLNIK